MGDLYIVNTTTAATAYTSEITAVPVIMPATSPATISATATAPLPATATAPLPATSASTGRSEEKKRKRSIVEVRESSPAPRATAATAKSISESRLWHRRFAHLHPTALRSLIGGFTRDDAMCDVCIQAKHKQKLIRTKVKQTTIPFELVHSDVCGPFATPTGGNNRYFILFINDYTRWTSVWLLPNKKAETCTAAYQTFQKKVEATGYTIKRFRCDNERGEHDNRLLRMLLAGSGTTFEPCPPHAHHKNGVAERMIATITEKASAMLIDSQAQSTSGERQYSRRSTFIDALQTTASQSVTIGTATKPHTKHPMKCCEHMRSPQSTRTAIRFHAKLPSTIYGDSAAL